MKRHLLIIAICLLLGAATTVAVCWASACRPLPRNWSSFAQEGYSAISGGPWKVYRTDRFARVRLQSLWAFNVTGSLTTPVGAPPARDLLPQWSRMIPYLEPGGAQYAHVVAEGTGWPLVAMFAHYRRGIAVIDGSGNYDSPVLLATGVLITDKGGPDTRILPTRIVGAGFVVDTIALGALWWLILFGPFALRGLWRACREMRGLCPKCAYPVGESDVCTECGCELRARTT